MTRKNLNMLEALYQNWTQDPTKRKWLFSYLPLLLAFLILIPLLAWQLANLYWFFKSPLDMEQIEPVSITKNEIQTQQNVDINNIKNANLFGTFQAEPTEVIEEPQEDAPETTLNLTLNGTLVSTNEEDSLAIITKDNDEKVYRVDDELQSNVTVAAIRAEQVVINNRGRNEALNLPKESQTPNQAISRRPTNRRASAQADRLANQLKQDFAKNPAKLTDIIRLKKGKLSSGTEGFRIYAGKERQKFNQLGLKAGDFVTAVNGMPVADQNPFQLFQTLNNAPYINLSIERNGQPTEISFDLAQTR